MSRIGSYILENEYDVSVESSNQDSDNYFARVTPKEISNNSQKLKEYAKKYYDTGNFSQFNLVCPKYLLTLKELSEPELHLYLIKYFLSCVLRRNYDMAITEISKLKMQYHSNDIAIYVL